MNLRYLIRRLIHTIPGVLGAVTLVFVVVRLAPGDPIDVMLGLFQESVTPQMREALRQQFGLDKPIHFQYFEFVWNVLRGNLGVSLLNGVPVLEVIIPHMRPTLMLAAGGLSVAVLMGVPIGVMAAVKRNTMFDYAVMSFVVIWLSVPAFWFAILLIYSLGFKLSLFPLFGGGAGGNLLSELHSLVLPSIAIGARSAALLARMTRSATLDVLSQDYIRTARSKGLTEQVVVYKHALRNAAIPVVTIIGMDLAYLLGGTVIIETVFARQGLGKTLIDAIFNRDYPVVQGCIFLFAAGVIAVNFLTDVVYSWIDRRIQYS